MRKKNDPVFSADAGPSLHTARWQIGDFELDETRRELRHKGVLVPVEPKPLNLLMQFARKPGELITKTELMETLWTGTIVSDAVLSNSVKKLRDALDPFGTEWIKTVHGFGYRFDAPVVLMASEPGAPLAPTLNLKPGDLVPGRSGWQLVKRLGSAGDSWLAQHRKLPSRRVFKFTNDARALVALKREMTIFRLLKQSLGDNRDYVELIDWNFDEPPWFLEAEYCEGGSLQEWLASIGGPQTLSQELRIELIARIADALSAVHQLGVLHKDLKPGNVLIVPGADGDCPTIKLGDFGSGRVLDDQRLIELGISRVGVTASAMAGDSTSGTPLYYAPEVLAGHPPTLKADLYALGIMLYQLVAGDLRLVFAPGWERNIDDPLIREDIAAVSEGDPAKRMADASELARRLRSLPERREARAQAVADAMRIDEERLAERVRIDAAERAVERLRARRFGLRIAVAALLGGVTISTALYFKARTAQQQAEASATQSNAVRDYLAKGIFEEIDPNKISIRNLSVKELLDAASKQMSKRFQTDPRLEATLRRSLGQTYAVLDFNAEATREFDRALKLFLEIDGEVSEEALDVASKLVTSKYVIGQLSDFTKQIDLLEQRAVANFGPRNDTVLRLQLERARADYFAGRWVNSTEKLNRLLKIIDEGVLPQKSLIESILSLKGFVDTDLSYYDIGESELRSALASAANRVGNDQLNVGKIHMQLGISLVKANKIEEAENQLRIARRVLQKWIKDDDGPMLMVRWGEAELQAIKGNTIEAEELIKSVILDADRVTAGGIRQSGGMRQVLAMLYARNGKWSEAELVLHEALTDFTAAVGAHHPYTRSAKLQLAELFLSMERIGDARDIILTPEALRFSDLPTDHPFVLRLQVLVRKLGIEQDLARKIN
ncbi:winged helix-turn-helix domain-containing protein [Nevskia sp.]|uniref:protein kinase domain-containing protein n=1 Tax=Nevskia sp. TaxID=1929292 RepID=UPI0025FB030D|nr:winged helix-turn-helix domain-containing protein [Nevskia sp.]